MTGADLIAFIKKNPIGIACGVVAVLFAGAAYYRGLDVPEVVDLLDQKVTESARIAANVKNATQLTDQLAKITAAGKEIQDRLIRVSDLANNLQYFYRLEADTGTKLIELRQNPSGKSAGGKALTGVSFSVSLQGDYLAILDVLRRLESSGHYCRVMSANLASVGPDRNSPIKLALGLELLGQP